MKVIVVGYDGSEAAQRALERAGYLATLTKAKVVVTSAVPVVVGEFSGVPGEELREAEGRLAEQGITPELIEAAGDPAEAIALVAEQQKADLIVVGTREPSLVERLIGGSVSESLQRRAHCDVLIVH